MVLINPRKMSSATKTRISFLIIIISLILNFGCKSQRNENITLPISTLKPPFQNQGEQEDYWAQEVFKNEYKKSKYEKYFGEIENIDNEKLIYDNKSFILYGVNDTLIKIFTEGILYPQLIDGGNSEIQKSDTLSASIFLISEYARTDYLKITNLEELIFLSDSPKVKRFRFWLNRHTSSNPQVYLLELTNKDADSKTDLKEFIENSQLTFLKEAWIII